MGVAAVPSSPTRLGVSSRTATSSRGVALQLPQRGEQRLSTTCTWLSIWKKMLNLDSFGSIWIHLSMNFTSAYRNRPLARKPKRCAACYRVRSPPAITAADWSSESGPALVLCRDDSQPHGCNLLHEVRRNHHKPVNIHHFMKFRWHWMAAWPRSLWWWCELSDIGSIMLYRSLFCQLDQRDMKYPHVSTSVRTGAIRFFPIRKEVRQSCRSWALAELICQLFFHILCIFVLSFLPLCPPFRYFCFAYAMFTDQSSLSRLRRRQGSQGESMSSMSKLLCSELYRVPL